MDRRSFIMTLIGGMTVASLGSVVVAEAAAPKITSVTGPTPEPAKPDQDVSAEMRDALDKGDAEFSQYYYYRRRPRYYARPRYYYRPRPRYYYRPRYYARPRRRFYYY